VELFPITSKVCRDCRVQKPLDEFPLQKGGRFGRHPLCKPCRSAQERRRYERDRDAILERTRSDPVRRAAKKWWQLKGRHGIAKHDYLTLLWAQSGRCAICFEWFGLGLRVDHDHATGEVRGLLCDACNIAIGHLGDDRDSCLAAAAYLRARR
jgi:hypothetical protein